MLSEALAGASSPAAYALQERGAGGKLRRPFSRKAPSTPYDRPPSQHRPSGATSAAGGSWMSKIVHPAYRLIAGGAARFLPSVFSSSSTHSLPVPPTDSTEEGLEQETNNENQDSSINLCLSKSTAHEGPSEQEGWSDISKPAEVGRADPDLCQIEQLIEGKTFCREDIDRLMGILQARVVDAEGGGLNLNANTSEKAAMVDISLGNPKSKGEEKQENVEEHRLTTLTPLLQPKANEEIGASPVEIAKAYMGSRASKFDTGSKSLLPKNERLFSHTNESPSNRFLLPPSPKPSICWPGAIVQEQHGCVTPHSLRSSSRLNKHSRTPYSRTIYSRSRSKPTQLGSDSRKLTDISATTFRKQTPLYGESRMRATEDVQGSVGPIRRLRNKFASETPRRGSPSLWSSPKDSVQVKESIFGDNPLATKSVEPTVISTFNSSELKGLSEADTSVVHPQSRKVARQILDEVCRTPTQKEKSEELKLVMAKKNSLTSQASGTSTTNDAATTSYAGGFLPDKERESPFFKIPSANLPTIGINGADSISTPASNTLPHKGSVSFGNIRPMSNNQDPSQANEIPYPTKAPVVPTSSPLAGTRVLNVPKAPTSGTKPVLAPISVDKSNHRVRFADNSSSGFTFPIAAPSISSEPPTPSIMPISSVNAASPSRDDTKPPTYTFGENKSAAPLVFSFASTSNAPATLMMDTPVFKFGSEGSSLCFRLVGEDAVGC